MRMEDDIQSTSENDDDQSFRSAVDYDDGNNTNDIEILKEQSDSNFVKEMAEVSITSSTSTTNAQTITNNTSSTNANQQPTIVSSNSTTTTIIPRTVFPLHCKWNIWFDHPKAAPAGSEFKDKLKLCGTFQTVEGFWRIFNNIKPASDLSVQSNYSIFRHNIEPAWEHTENCNGGKFVLTIPKKEGKAGRTNDCWIRTVIAVIGETMDVTGNQINGTVVSLRKHEDRVSLWLKSSEPRICVAIGERWKLCLNIEKNALKFVTHQAAVSTGRSFRTESHFKV